MNNGERTAGQDWSTIDLKALWTLGSYNIPKTYSLQQVAGNGCHLDPPGYPTYFTRCVYTRSGNIPGKDVTMVITGPNGVHYNVAMTTDVDAMVVDRLRRLWKPLPLEHHRTQAWIRALFIHFSKCYREPSTRNPREILIYPVPYYKLHHFKDDIRFSDAWRASELERISKYNEETKRYAQKIAVPDNHVAVLAVREYYPKFRPDTQLLSANLKSPGYWWEVLAERPEPENCPGSHGHKHPVNVTWCQFCGWRHSKGQDGLRNEASPRGFRQNTMDSFPQEIFSTVK